MTRHFGTVELLYTLGSRLKSAVGSRSNGEEYEEVAFR